MSIHHRHCAIPDCRRHALRGKATCRYHVGHPEGRLLNQQTRRLARLLTALDLETDPLQAEQDRQRTRLKIERGDFNEILAPTFSELVEHARRTRDLSWLIGANRVAITRLITETEDPYKLAMALSRLVNQNSRLARERAKPIDRRREPVNR
jgi:hypothetical protein